MKDTRGFTLLELLMVVIIIAILASIALPQYFKTVERSRGSEALQILATIRGAEQRYKAQSPTNVYTLALTDIDVEVPGVGVNPPSVNWAYSIAGINGIATRAGTGATIQVNLDSGATCTSLTATYGLPPAPC